MSDYDVTIERRGETKLRFNLADAAGRPSRAGGTFRMHQFPKQALKLQQGDTFHSDREPPYASLEQREFSGGRAWDRLERDKTRFYDSYRLQTWLEGMTLLGPEETYCSGIRDNEVAHWWDDNDDAAEDMVRLELDPDSYNYYSYKFTPSSNITPDYVYLALGFDYQNTNWKLNVSIYDDSGGEPNSQLFTTGDLQPDAYEMVRRLAFSSPSQLNSGTTYHLVIKNYEPVPLSWNYKGYYVMAGDDVAASTAYKSDDGSTWTAATKGIFFRLVEDDTQFDILPFEHLGALYMAISYRDGSDPKIFMNGERGTSTSAAAGSNKLLDGGASWTTNQWAGAICRLYSGKGADSDRPWRLISSNTGTELTLDSDWDEQPDLTTKYVIVQDDTFTEVTGHGMEGRITDIATYGNVVYFARGDFRDIFHMYDDTFTLEAGNRGSFIEIAPLSTTGEMRVYLARASFPPVIQTAVPQFGDDDVTIDDLDFTEEITVDDSSMELDDGSWADHGAPPGHVQSNTRKYDGNWSRKVTANGADQGGTQTISGLAASTTYHVEGWINSDVGDVKLEFDGTELDDVTTNDQWVYVHGYKTVSGTTATLRFLSKDAAATFYYDAVKITKIESPLPAGHDKITGLSIADEPRRLYVLTDAGVLRENYGTYRDVSPGEFISASDDRNGASQARTGADMYLSFLDNVVKYSDEQITIIGPNLDEGLPSDRRGAIADMTIYGEWLLVAIDGGTDNYSSILLFNRLGWHEFYRAPAVGMRITGLYIQPMPGNYVDRLWFNEGADICHCHIDLNPYGNDNFRYTFSGWVDMASLYGSIPDIEKFYHKIRVAADDLATGDQYISTAPRDVDGWSNGGEPPTGETYEQLWGEFESSPVSEISIDEFWGMATFTLKRLQVHLALHTINRDTSPVFRAIVIDYMEHLPVAWSYTMRLLTTDRRRSLTGEVQEDAAEDDLNTLLTYVNSAEPIRIYTPFAVAGEFPAKLTAITDIESAGYTRRGDKERYVFTLTAVDA